MTAWFRGSRSPVATGRTKGHLRAAGDFGQPNAKFPSQSSAGRSFGSRKVVRWPGLPIFRSHSCARCHLYLARNFSPCHCHCHHHVSLVRFTRSAQPPTDASRRSSRRHAVGTAHYEHREFVRNAGGLMHDVRHTPTSAVSTSMVQSPRRCGHNIGRTMGGRGDSVQKLRLVMIQLN